ncbi:hypothetical protein IPA_07160 [Ignicoccus pacificus DSM 13166]|uniref:Uncharacterized protein n=1 Tax=Ignicoccus pacificus DSM 13166 TaxID=940294 RepID=A0A977PLM6_9CREN|nr:hypothetical protein IPA_07160 [Ignicoccus pacificus DSM 13166]
MNSILQTGLKWYNEKVIETYEREYEIRNEFLVSATNCIANLELAKAINCLQKATTTFFLQMHSLNVQRDMLRQTLIQMVMLLFLTKLVMKALA